MLGCVAVLCFAVCGAPQVGESEPLPPAVTPVGGQSLTVSNLKLPDGTRVRFMLGLVGCGVMELGKGEAEVKDGSFELPFDGSQLQWERDVDLFIKPAIHGKFECDTDDEVLILNGVTPTVGSTVDASKAEPTNMGCWLFGRDDVNQ